MKIGVFDDNFFALQGRLLSEDHDLELVVNLPENLLRVSPTKDGTVKTVPSFVDFFEDQPDFVIIGTSDHDNNLRRVFNDNNIPSIGYDDDLRLMEFNREYAHYIHKQYGLDKTIKIPKQIHFTEEKTFRKFIAKEKNRWVLKPSSRTFKPGDVLTLFFDPAVGDMLLINDFLTKNVWFDEGGYGGVIAEQYVVGHEVGFGAWFDGKQFVDPLYYYTEYKGVQNNNHGKILTGEVGSALGWTWQDEPILTDIRQAMKKLEPFLEGKCSGMIDINTILADDGNYYLIEYTPRFGRPSLELQLASFKGPIGEAFAQLARGYSKIWSNKKYWPYRFTIGVAVFDYGYPTLLEELEDRPQPLLFQTPKVKAPFQNIEQIWCPYSHDDKAWSSNTYGRQFMSIGTAHTEEQAIREAYAPLKDWNYTGFTWRDDIGNDLASLTKKIHERK